MVSAKTRIDVIVDSVRRREPFTHFLSLPVTSPSVREKFLEFQDEVLRSCDSVCSLLFPDQRLREGRPIFFGLSFNSIPLTFCILPKEFISNTGSRIINQSFSL